MRDIPHPNMVNNLKLKTQAKIGRMLIDIVIESGKKKEIKISKINEISKKYRLGDKTFAKYLRRSIYVDTEEPYNTKCLALGPIDVILIREVMYLEERYRKLQAPQHYIIRYLLAYLGRTL